MKKVRIIKRTFSNGSPKYVIQQKHFLFFWWWVDAWVNSFLGAACEDSFDSFEEALRNLYLFDGTKSVEEPVFYNYSKP